MRFSVSNDSLSVSVIKQSSAYEKLRIASGLVCLANTGAVRIWVPLAACPPVLLDSNKPIVMADNVTTNINIQDHRKKVKHFDIPGQVHELTFSCYKQYPLLKNNDLCVMLSRSIDSAFEKKDYELIAFVYMPEHVHLLVFPNKQASSISRLLYAIKRPFSNRAKQYLQKINSKWMDRLIVQERPGKHSFRFWQEGSGYDRNLTKTETIRKSIKYIHNNPLRRELCSSLDDWKWSSWNHYFDLEKPIDIDLPKVHGLSGKSRIFLD